MMNHVPTPRVQTKTTNGVGDVHLSMARQGNQEHRTQHMVYHVLCVVGAVANTIADEEVYNSVLQKYEVLSSLNWSDFMTLSQSEYEEWLSEEHVTFGDNRKIRQLWQNHRS